MHRPCDWLSSFSCLALQRVARSFSIVASLYMIHTQIWHSRTHAHTRESAPRGKNKRKMRQRLHYLINNSARSLNLSNIHNLIIVVIETPIVRLFSHCLPPFLSFFLSARAYSSIVSIISLFSFVATNMLLQIRISKTIRTKHKSKEKGR